MGIIVHLDGPPACHRPTRGLVKTQTLSRHYAHGIRGKCLGSAATAKTSGKYLIHYWLTNLNVYVLDSL